MTATDVVIPANVTELKEAMGEAMLVAGFTAIGMAPPEHALQSARRGNNVAAANTALTGFPTPVQNLGLAAERALFTLDQGFQDAMDSWMSDLVGALSDAQSVLRDIPGQYLGKLLLQAFNNEDDFRRVMELFRDVARDTNL